MTRKYIINWPFVRGPPKTGGFPSQRASNLIFSLLLTWTVFNICITHVWNKDDNMETHMIEIMILGAEPSMLQQILSQQIIHNVITDCLRSAARMSIVTVLFLNEHKNIASAWVTKNFALVCLMFMLYHTEPLQHKCFVIIESGSENLPIGQMVYGSDRWP